MKSIGKLDRKSLKFQLVVVSSIFLCVLTLKVPWQKQFFNKVTRQKRKIIFKEFINMPQVSVYVPPIDLNIDQGRIEIPYNFVIRFATSVFVDGKQIV